MTTNPILTLTPDAMKRRRLVGQLIRARAFLHSTYELYLGGNTTTDRVIEALHRLHCVAKQLDAMDTAEALSEV